MKKNDKKIYLTQDFETDEKLTRDQLMELAAKHASKYFPGYSVISVKEV